MHNIKRFYFIKDGNKGFESSHPIVEIDGIDKKMRGRSEMIVIKDDQIYLSKKKHGLCCENIDSGFIYDVPGGGWNPNENFVDAAIRECKEEARINVNGVVAVNDYYVLYDDPKEWIKKKIDSENWWYGYYTIVFVGEYNGEYTGNINEEDKDDIINTGKFYPISEVFDLLNPIHQEAIKRFTFNK